jgi:hypothetical protein
MTKGHRDGTKGLEVIGHELRYGEEPSEDIRSRYNGFGEGATLDHTYELEDDTLRVWMGERNSTAYYEGTFDDSGPILLAPGTTGWGRLLHRLDQGAGLASRSAVHG